MFKKYLTIGITLLVLVISAVTLPGYIGSKNAATTVSFQSNILWDSGAVWQ